MKSCGISSPHLSYTSHSPACFLLEKRIKNSAIVEFTNDGFEALYGDQTHAFQGD